MTRDSLIVLAAACCLAAFTPAASSPAETETAKVFGVEVEQVTLDVVVLDGKGRPVTGLKREDFTVTDEGQVREIVSFDVISRSLSTASATPTPRAPVATNLTPAEERGRTFVVIFDDLHLSPATAQNGKAAVAAFLEKGTADGDTVTLIATGGEAWWTTRLPGGRADLMKILKRLDGRRPSEAAGDRLTDYEAFQIHHYRDAQVARRVLDRFERYGNKSRQEMQSEEYKQLLQQMVPGAIDPYIENRAAETFIKVKSRMDASLQAIERATNALAENRDRKALLLVSEGFVDDTSNGGFKRVVEAARRVNATLYFVDARGLRTLAGGYGAEFGAPLDEQDRLSAMADMSREGEGAAGLSASTGGFPIRDSNDFENRAAQIGRESQSYYLLGFNPGAVPRDGRYRRLKVQARGKGLTVRARKGYYAPSDDAASNEPPPKNDPVLQHAIDAPGLLDAIPLRLAAYALEDVVSGRVHVAVVAETDVSKVTFAPGPDAGPAVAKLETLVVVAHRESGEFDRNDLSVDLQRRSEAPAAGPLWYSFVRDFRLPPGGYQVKLIVRDTVTKKLGTVVHEFEVPPSNALRVTSPILTDVLRDGSVPALLARRTFGRNGLLYCRFDVFGATKGSDGIPRVRSGHSLLRRSDGTLVGRTPPNPITPTSIGAMVRMVQIPLSGLDPGDYELVISVEDELTGDVRELRESFAVAG